MFPGSFMMGAFSPAELLTIDSNALLRNIPTTCYKKLFYAADLLRAGDTGTPLIFYSSNFVLFRSAGGNEMGGTQVKSLDNKCWLAQYDGIRP